ncbi:putative C2 domain-containing protein [Helianthus anomalus]
MNNLKGLLRIRIKRGVNLAVRDINTSDPYIIIRMGKQKVKTRIIERDVNPVWNEDLTIFVYNTELPIKLVTFIT